MTEISLYDAAGADPHLLDALTGGWLWDPFVLLGAHPLDGRRVLRVFAPGVLRVEAMDPAGRWQVELQPTLKPGLLAGWLPEPGAYRLRLHWSGGVQETEDPYAFSPQLSDFDLHLFAEGRHLELARCMGAQPRVIDGVAGVLFAVWAPNARRVSVVGDFNSWDGRRHPLRSRGGSGVWELFVPRVTLGALYKFELQGEHGLLPLKADPLALQAELAPSTASIVADPAPFAWSDGEWMAGRAARHRPQAPITVYELHAESWRYDADGKPLNWLGLAEQLIPYVCDMGFTHIELMPIMCHPFGGSWGYQPLGLFAPQASLGTPEQLAGFVDRCHAAGIGVILDWVPAHFPADEHGLARFDGTALYEHADPREGFHQDWNTLIYNFGRNEVRSFLLSSALHWLQSYHIDGLRVDAVASMLYRDYSRKDGEWVPNRYGGRENLEAISFLKELNVYVGERCPGAMTIAEESTAWPAVSRPTEHGGLGFWFKWNMGWMNDTLRYIEKNPVHRAWEHHLLTFGLLYAFSENFMLPLSHDEVVHGKRSMLAKMPGDEWQRFANLRCYYAFMWSHPGKKLLFMGSELAEYDEWRHDRSLNWPLLQFPLHRGVQALVRELNRQYCSNESLHLADGTADGFRWVVGDDHANSVLAFCRMPGRGGRPLLAICNFTPVPRRRYRVGVPLAGGWKPILNTDAIEFGGSGMIIADHVETEDRDAHGCEQSLMLDLPPLATLWLMPV